MTAGVGSRTEAAAAAPRRNAAALVLHQIRYEQLSFWRNPQSAFFLFAFPLVFFAILAGVFGNTVLFKDDGRTVTGLQYYSSTITAVSVMGACYSQLAITVSLRRQEGILKRLRGTPLPAWVMFAGLVAHCIIISFIDFALILIMGLLYGVPMPGHWDAIIVTLVVGAAAFCALGVAVANLVRNAEAAPGRPVHILPAGFHIGHVLRHQFQNPQRPGRHLPGPAFQSGAAESLCLRPRFRGSSAACPGDLGCGGRLRGGPAIPLGPAA